MASSTHRQAKEFKKCVYIALPINSGRLPFDGNESDTTSDSDDLPESPIKPAAPRPSNAMPSAETTMGDEKKASAPDPPKFDVPKTGPLDDVRRLLANVHRPSPKQGWWPTVTPGLYAGALVVIPQFQNYIQQSQNGASTALATDTILTLFTHGFFPQIAFVLDFAAYDESTQFCIGPHALEPIVNVLLLLRRFALNSGGAQAQTCVEQVDVYGAAIFSAVLTFRNTVDRELYDPPNVASVRRLLNNRRDHFGMLKIAFPCSNCRFCATIQTSFPSESTRTSTSTTQVTSRMTIVWSSVHMESTVSCLSSTRSWTTFPSYMIRTRHCTIFSTPRAQLWDDACRTSPRARAKNVVPSIPRLRRRRVMGRVRRAEKKKRKRTL
ncbi:hypothetical protein FB45DRAFT_268196 [Roridomyces roridus]|uniref:Uncharacterized protein n=1 Tax=Roridomyces roridus TaxID=1738132 RepID=A0AAD7B8Y4_9AGAR|nr:hypothetical protein FB45DRAFT_268196 [Roridomyces roridus]